MALFNELQANIFDQEIIDNAYADYKVQYEAKRYSSFYVEHQNDEWFKEKYDPEIYVKWKNERNSQAKKISKQFLEWYKEIEGKIKLELNEEDEFNKKLKEKNVKVETGIFGADMQVELINDGPITIMLEK